MYRIFLCYSADVNLLLCNEIAQLNILNLIK